MNKQERNLLNYLNKKTRMNKQEKIDIIYKEIANKELSFGCIVKYKYNGKEYQNTFIGINPNNRRQVIQKSIGCFNTGRVSTFNKSDLIEIIGHPVLIGDILDWIEKEKTINNEGFEKALSLIYNNWQLKRKPIEEQLEECIDYVFNLLPKD